ncbi:MAG: hypothetical protein COA96_06375 [SAR86 cluster bacterium]|uniref:Transglutaminase-like domain-containing protein n=1 Tax=SAR86 cluster bacterium TaxID=2030880 RepID=A0A2A5B2W2_9GAMM|nr:MAG: hypothetical protein COA96_06375 [SAR86 cluster bacterium]
MGNYLNKLKILAVTVLALLSVACVNINIETNFIKDEEIYQAIISQSSDSYPEIDPLYINDEIKEFIDTYISSGDSEELRVDKLQELLYGEDHLFVQYSDDKTHTAMEAFYAREGNCLSIMNLYIAMARYSGIDANFQTVDVQPSWDRRGGFLVLSQHINATGKFSVRRRYIVDFTPEIALQQLTSEVVTDQDARSLYFNNLGVETLIAGDFEQALVYFKNALFLDLDSSIAWNNVGALYNRMGNTQFAEYSYLSAFSFDQSNATAINNLAKFYRQSGNLILAGEYEKAIERFNNKNPYFHYVQGSLAFLESDFRAALASFRKALKIKELEPDFHLAVGRTYLELGDTERAEYYNESAKTILAQNDEIYRPSSEKVRIIEAGSILRSSSPGLSIYMPGARRNTSRR